MFSVSFFSVALFVFIAVSATLFSNKKSVGFIPGIAAIAFYIFIVGVLAPSEFGWSHVPRVAEKFTERLDTGTAYQLVASKKNGKSQVLLVKEHGTSDFRAIRVDSLVPPPEYFTLIDGEPVAIAAPAVVATPGK